MDFVRPQSDSPSPGTAFHRLSGIAEIAANVVIICAVFFTGFMWWHQAAKGSSQVAACGSTVHPAPLPGTRISLPGVDWSSHPSTLVVAISSTCPHCVNSSSFYSKLTRSAHRNPVVVVMPQSEETARSFLARSSITPSRMISANLSSIQVSVTPTLVLVSSSGVVKQTWVGELDDSQRREVLTVLDHL